MRWIIIAGALAFVILATATFLPSPAAEARAREFGFSDETISIGQQYSFQRRLLFWAQTGIQLTLWTWLIGAGHARRIADVCLNLARGWWLVAVLFVGMFCFVLEELISLPFDVARLMLMWSWEMSQRSLASWAGDRVMHSLVFGLAEAPALLVLFLLIRYFPRTWWLLASAATTAFGVVLAFLLPVVVSPIFNTFTPLRETQWAPQEPRVQALVSKANIPVQDILVMDASRQSHHSNAYFTGFGSTRRIVLYDNLLRKHTPEEIESILAHEIGHWQHDHITKGLAMAGLGTVAGFLGLWWILRRSVGRSPLHLHAPWDQASVVLIVFLAILANWIALPVQNVVSREFERQADQVSLELAGQEDAFIAAERKLTIDNKMNVAPSPFNVWLFASHPPTVERIRMAMEWKQKR